MKAKVDQIVQLTLDFYAKLPKKGKPCLDKKEWTVLSAFVLQRPNKGFEVVALGTGTKCLGKDEVSINGDLVHDSHAEVIAKRAFVLYLIEEVYKAFEGQENTIFEVTQPKKVKLKSDFTFHFYSSFPPCGDATIAPKPDVEDLSEPLKKKAKMDIHRTGAKSSLDTISRSQDVYHALGAVRTKPGRGNPTLSLSCSDKMAKWCQLGFQGSLLAAFIAEPIIPQTIVVGNSQTSLESLNRALFTRFDLDNQNVTLAKTELNFHHDKDELSCDASLFWNPLTNGVIVQGRKQGCIKKHYGTTKAQSQLCRKAIAVAFKRKFEKDFEGIKTYQGLKAKCRQSSDFYLPLYDVLNEKFKLNNSERKEKDEISLIS